MLQKIKSSFILKNVFIYVNEGIKLNSIKYNKAIQRRLNLTLVDYRRFSGRYIEEINGIINEFNSYNHKLLFEGQYENGKRNGKGIQ